MSVSANEFRAWMAPKVDGLHALSSAIDDVAVRHEHPAPRSRAMSELNEEAQHRNTSAWDRPMEDAITFGGSTLRAASDYLRGLGSLFDSDHPSLYGHISLSRAAMEAAVVSAWLSEPGAGRPCRTKRGLCELLYSANEVKALNIGHDRVHFWLDVAATFGWTVNNSRMKPIIDGERRPRTWDGIVELSGGDSDSHVGDLLYSQASAVDHVTWWGINYAFHLDSAQRDERAGTGAVPVGLDGAKVSSYLYYAVKVVIAAAEARFTYMGWRDDDWKQALSAGLELERRLLEAAISGRSSAR